MEQVQVRYTCDFFLNSLGLILNLQVFRLNLFNKSLLSTLLEAMYYTLKTRKKINMILFLQEIYHFIWEWTKCDFK